MQGALRIGAAYVPIDPLSPVTRAAAIVKDCGIRVLAGSGRELALLHAELGASLPPSLRFEGDGPGTPIATLDAPSTTALPKLALDASSLAYILYTSGSTGVPKGVCISQENAGAFIEWARRLLEPTPADVFGNHAPFHFDLSVLDVYVAFSAGASIAIVPETAAFVPARMVDLISEHGVTIWYSVPTAISMMLESGLFERSLPLRTICFAGEPFPPRALARLRRETHGMRLFNFYGPTETNVVTYYEVPSHVADDVPIPIGTAASGAVVWAEKEDGSRASSGEVGELFVTGPTVMLGYWGRPPHPHGTPYPTGDIVRIRSDGGFDYLGRRDGMVKLKGYRVELGEVETALGRHPEIAAVAATVVGSGLDAKLIAAAVPRGERRVPLLELKTLCSKHLPRYMIIDRIVWLESLPRTSNGKLDRRAITDACQ
jgi:amino acid adenylation domain-containing protein